MDKGDQDPLGGSVQQREVEILNKEGLNAAASAKLAQVASEYLSEVSVARRGRKVNAKSLMGVMMLVAGQGSRIVIETDGPDETEALEAIVALIANSFGGYA
jgi:phosphocarrier protein